ncbi:MAG: N-acetylmuramoyl-L-alanine amidase, partial [Ruthenibacterium sp.]
MTEIKTMLAPKGSVCRPSYAMKPEYITIHNTANTLKGAGAISHGSYLQDGGASKYVSYHYAVDDKQIVRIIPDNEAAWHAGDGAKGTGNRKSIGIEICENPESNLLNATNNTAELVAHLMKDYGILLGKVVQHNHWSGKNCPNRIR